MNILEYIKRDWDYLPKSSFNHEEVVIFHCVRNDNMGWGHHSYEGYGGDKDGNLMWCYSSGCSCHGTCRMEHKKDIKVFQINGIDLSKFDPENINFTDLIETFTDY